MLGWIKFVLLLGAAPAASFPPVSPSFQGVGNGVFLVKADAAWVGPGRRLEPAYVLVQGGRILALSSRRPRRAGRLIEVSGTLAPGVVDAWARLLPDDLPGNRHSLSLERVAESLPADEEGFDPGLSARVAAAREAGLAAAWLSAPGRGLEGGRGTAVIFSDHDLPRPAGREAVEFSLGGPGPGGLLLVEQLGDRLKAAADLRDAREDYQEKLEKYHKDLEDYQKKLEEFLSKNGKKNGKAKGNGSGKESPGLAGDPDQEKKKDHGNGSGKGKEKAPQGPKRPKPPREPGRNPGLDLLLQAMDRELPLRVRADRAGDILRLLELREKYGFDLVLVGGAEADLAADRLADAEVPVILAAASPAMKPRPGRSFAARFLALRKAGVEVAIASGGGEGTESLLLLRAGEAVAAGGDPEDVWASLTSVPARLLGLEKTYGTLHPGAAAEFLLFEGSSPFDASKPLHGFRPGK